MRLTYRYRLYPTTPQDQALHAQVDEACRLYNAALQERRDAWKTARQSVNYYHQANQLKAIRADGDVGVANFSACQDVLRRVRKTFDAFFRRVKAGQVAGYPRFKPCARYDSLTFPSYGDGCRLRDNGRLYLQGVGDLKVKLHRPVVGQIKTVTVKREAGKWFVCFSVVEEPTPLPVSAEAIGVDVGLTTFATLSDGRTIENPRLARAAARRLRLCQRRVARRKRRSRGRRSAVRLLQRAHAHLQRQRADFHHKATRSLVNRYGLIVVEDLNVKGLAAGMLAKSVHDVGWSSFLEKLAYKAESAGRVLLKVDPRGTSQTCPCGARVPKALSDRAHVCTACGLVGDRDHVSAQVVLSRGLRDQDSTWAVAPCVS
jgi:putative transposase